MRDSPSAQSWKRLLSNRIALGSLVTLSLVGLLCFGASIISSHHPETQQLWIGAVPPGTVHPPLESLQRAEVGQPPKVHPQLKDAQTLTFHTQALRFREVRVAIVDGHIHRLFWVEGAIPIEELHIEAPTLIRQRFRQGSLSPPIESLHLKMGAPAPKAYLSAQTPVAFFRIYDPPPPKDVVHLTLQNGLIESITVNGNPVRSWGQRAEHIQRVDKNGHSVTISHLLGTDLLGRDLLSRILHGGQISLLVGIVATAVSLVIGVIVGLMAGMGGSRWERLIMSGVDILYAIPFMFLVILLLTLFSRSLFMLFIALGAVQWLTMSRIVCHQVKAVLRLPYVDAARSSGAKVHHLALRHILPNIGGPIIIYTTLTVPTVILEESFLAFLGLTVQFDGRSLDSWGSLVHQGVLALGSQGGHIWILLFPSLAMVITLLSLNFLGDGCRDALDPKRDHRV